MTLYAALLYYPRERYWLDPAEASTAPGYARFFEAASGAGVLRGGEALYPDDKAVTITVRGEGGPVRTTPGPAVDTEEILGGFYLLEAASLDQATTWAAQIPAAWRGRIELRPIVPMQNKPG
jgi:hypothetical protein